VQTYGVGAHTGDLAAVAGELGRIWQASRAVTAGGDISLEASNMSDQLRDLAAARATVTACAKSQWGAGTGGEVCLDDETVASAAELMPAWATGRPGSYSLFVQPARQGTWLVVNHLYAGWGRFTSRFLDMLIPDARMEVAAQIRRHLDPDAVTAQFRPVNGFNANLHPLMVGVEVGEDPAWCDILLDDLEMCHDPSIDQVRLRHRRTGRHVDVLYLGFLMPFALPDRLIPLCHDLSAGAVALQHLTPRFGDGDLTWRPRLRHRDVVLSRGQWRVGSSTVAALLKSASIEGEVPAAAVAAWRAGLGLPAEVFVESAPVAVSGSDSLRAYLARRKPQYVDLNNALHLRCLPQLLTRYDNLLVSEALPVPGRDSPDGRVMEIVAEIYRPAHRR
jgi:hypothetical protein